MVHFIMQLVAMEVQEVEVEELVHQKLVVQVTLQAHHQVKEIMVELEILVQKEQVEVGEELVLLVVMALLVLIQ
jgi:hypothetical protein